MRNLSASVFALAAAAGMSHAAVVFSEDFENGHIGQFSYEDYQDGGSHFEWDGNAETGDGNYTGGKGSAAQSNSGDHGEGEYDHAIVSPKIELGIESKLDYLSNYQNFANNDFADVDISTDGGQSWKNLLSWNQDHGVDLGTPGEAVTLDLSAYDNQTVQIRFHHYDPIADDLDWYWQVDQISITAIPAPGSLALLGLGGLVAGRRRRA